MVQSPPADWEYVYKLRDSFYMQINEDKNVEINKYVSTTPVLIRKWILAKLPRAALVNHFFSFHCWLDQLRKIPNLSYFIPIGSCLPPTSIIYGPDIAEAYKDMRVKSSLTTAKGWNTVWKRMIFQTTLNMFGEEREKSLFSAHPKEAQVLMVVGGFFKVSECHGFKIDSIFPAKMYFQSSINNSFSFFYVFRRFSWNCHKELVIPPPPPIFVPY